MSWQWKRYIFDHISKPEYRYRQDEWIPRPARPTVVAIKEVFYILFPTAFVTNFSLSIQEYKASGGIFHHDDPLEYESEDEDWGAP